MAHKDREYYMSLPGFLPLLLTTLRLALPPLDDKVFLRFISSLSPLPLRVFLTLLFVFNRSAPFSRGPIRTLTIPLTVINAVPP